MMADVMICIFLCTHYTLYMLVIVLWVPLIKTNHLSFIMYTKCIYMTDLITYLNLLSTGDLRLVSCKMQCIHGKLDQYPTSNFYPTKSIPHLDEVARTFLLNLSFVIDVFYHSTIQDIARKYVSLSGVVLDSTQVSGFTLHHPSTQVSLHKHRRMESQICNPIKHVCYS